MSIQDELRVMQSELEKERENDVIQRTLAKLIKIEKEAMYGSKVSNKSSRIEKIIESEFPHYKEKVNAPS